MVGVARSDGCYAAAFDVEGFGARVRVRVDDPALIPALIEKLPLRFAHAGTGAEPDAAIDLLVRSKAPQDARADFGDAQIVLGGAGIPLAALLDRFESHLRVSIALHARDYVVVHAGVIGWGGAAALFPARSFAGKSSLVAELIRRGAEYFSDEFALIDDRGLVHPWPRALALRDASGARRDVPASVLGAHVATRPAPAGLVVATDYRRNARWRPEPLTAAQSALTLFGHAVAARHQPARILDVLGRAVASARAIQTPRPDARLVAPRILSLMENGARR